MESGFPVPETPAYVELLEELKTRIREARLRATLAVNHELLRLYWEIGREIVARQESERWGSSVIRHLASDLKRTFPAPIPKLPWSHQVVLVEKLKDPQKRDWYGNAAAVHGWSRRVLEAQIESGLLERQGLAATNFDETLPRQQSDLAHGRGA